MANETATNDPNLNTAKGIEPGANTPGNALADTGIGETSKAYISEVEMPLRTYLEKDRAMMLGTADEANELSGGKTPKQLRKEAAEKNRLFREELEKGYAAKADAGEVENVYAQVSNPTVKVITTNEGQTFTQSVDDTENTGRNTAENTTLVSGSNAEANKAADAPKQPDVTASTSDANKSVRRGVKPPNDEITDGQSR